MTDEMRPKKGLRFTMPEMGIHSISLNPKPEALQNKKRLNPKRPYTLNPKP